MPITPYPSFADRIAVVTGAAQGLGRAIVELLVRQGGRAVAVDLNGDGLERLADEHDGLVAPIVADCATSGGISDALDAAETTWGAAAGLLVNNAAILASMPLLEHSDDVIERVLRINAGGPIISTREFARRLIEAELPGAVVNIASSSAFSPAPGGLTVYGASKGAVVAFTRNAASELAPHKIRVNCIAPGWMRTEMSGSDAAGPDAIARGRALLDRIPMRRSTEAEQVADAIVYLLSDRAAYITGVTLPVDGGLLAS